MKLIGDKGWLDAISLALAGREYGPGPVIFQAGGAGPRGGSERVVRPLHCANSIGRPKTMGLGVGKRMFDIALAGLLLVLLAPLLLAIAFAVAIFMGRPVLFTQERPGLRGRPFRLVKFRSMRDAVDTEGEPLADAQRLTGFGRLLRRSSLDELPELWNVLKGDMSLVGPRPLLMEYLPRYTAEQMRRHDVRPGITGWAQVNGRNDLGWDEIFRLDVWYVDHVSLLLDLKILLRTLKTVFSAEGVSQQGYATREKFRGTGP